MSFVVDSYSNILLDTKRGHCNGVFSNAKPILVLSIIDAISDGLIIGNVIKYDNRELKTIYKNSFIKYECGNDDLYRANVNITPYNMPFFHLNSEPYFHIKWADGVLPPPQAQSPSNKYLSKNVDYAFLDDELWELLQNCQIRYDYKSSLIRKFIKQN